MSITTYCEMCREYNAAAVDFRNQAANAQSDLAALLTRHNALVEAVAWERETSVFWEFGRTYTLVANDEALESMFAARAEADRLIANEGAADCKEDE